MFPDYFKQAMLTPFSNRQLCPGMIYADVSNIHSILKMLENIDQISHILITVQTACQTCSNQITSYRQFHSSLAFLVMRRHSAFSVHFGQIFHLPTAFTSSKCLSPFAFPSNLIYSTCPPTYSSSRRFTWPYHISSIIDYQTFCPNLSTFNVSAIQTYE